LELPEVAVAERVLLVVFFPVADFLLLADFFLAADFLEVFAIGGTFAKLVIGF
jgi:hypothetical protein